MSLPAKTPVTDMAAALYTLLASATDCPVYRAGGAPKEGVPRVTYTISGGTSQPIVSGGAALHRRARVNVVAVAESFAEASRIIEDLIEVVLCAEVGATIRATDVEYGPYDLPEPIEGAELMLPAVGVDLGVTYAARR